MSKELQQLFENHIPDRGFYDEAMWNLEQVKEGKRDGREHAQKIADDLVEYMYKVERG